MRGKLIFLGSIILVTCNISACHLWATANTPVSQQELCTKLKREAIVLQSNRNLEADTATSEQRARIQQQLKDQNCH